MEIPSVLKDKGVHRTYQPGEFLFHTGESLRGIYFIEEGEIRVFDMDPEGRELEVTRLRKGDIFGEAVLFSSGSVPFYAEAVLLSQVLLIAAKTIMALIEKEPDISRFFLKLMAQKCLILNQRVRYLGLKTVRQRLIHHLLTRCPGNNNCRIDLAMNKGDLARMLGTINETLSRNLKQLQEDGLIRVEGKKIHVMDCHRMREELL
jgi:CRP-like cAMP-binding protein